MSIKKDLSGILNPNLSGIRELMKESESSRQIRELLEQNDRISELMKESEPNQLFRMPYLDEASELFSKVREISDFYQRAFSPDQEEFMRLVSSIKTPWVDSIDALLSFKSVSKLSSVGTAIRTAPYDLQVSDTLRVLLGDWSQVELPEGLATDWRVRQEFYHTHGFDSSLTILPEPAFTDSLYKTGILYPGLSRSTPTPDELPEPEDSLDEHRWTEQRIINAVGVICPLENRLREYLHETMTRRFGQDWEKQRVPPDLYKAWEERRREAWRKGEKEQRLLWYADFAHYLPIIERRDNWEAVFKVVFNDREEIRVSLKRLYPLRNPTAHSRVITKDDFMLLNVEARRILKAIGKLDDDETL